MVSQPFHSKFNRHFSKKTILVSNTILYSCNFNSTFSIIKPGIAPIAKLFVQNPHQDRICGIITAPNCKLCYINENKKYLFGVSLTHETLMWMGVENNDSFQSAYKADLYKVVNVM